VGSNPTDGTGDYRESLATIRSRSAQKTMSHVRFRRGRRTRQWMAADAVQLGCIRRLSSLTLIGRRQHHFQISTQEWKPNRPRGRAPVLTGANGCALFEDRALRFPQICGGRPRVGLENANLEMRVRFPPVAPAAQITGATLRRAASSSRGVRPSCPGSCWRNVGSSPTT
jgi:hypothetical protein